MNNLQLKQILLEIQSNLRCIHCGQPYRTSNIHLRGSFKNMYLFQLACAQNHSAFATITVVGQKITSAPKIISYNDALSFHQELAKFEGDFTKVFSKK